MAKIFSGKNSVKFWETVNRASGKNKNILFDYGCKAQEIEQQRDALREFARNFFEWHANHFEDFSTEINAQLLSLANTAEPLIA